jgi:RNA polymerase sigma-70 factor, ECF subfamily
MGRVRNALSLAYHPFHRSRRYQWSAIPQPVVDDLVQETYLKHCGDKCRLLQDFACQHPEAITGYIKTIAVNVAHDHTC